MRLHTLVYVIAWLLTSPIYGFGQLVPVAPSLMLNIGGSNGTAYGSNLKSDAQGNTYVTGSFRDENNTVDFDPFAGVTTLGIRVSSFVAKYNTTGALVWVKSYMGDANGLDIDRNGNITVIGERFSNKARPNNVNIYKDAFILHLDNNGKVLWEKLIESGSKNIPIDTNRLTRYLDIQTGYKVASDDAGNLIAACSFGGSPDVDGVVTAKGTYDGLVVKYDPNGNVIWKFNLGATGLNINSAFDAKVDKENNIIVAGSAHDMVDYNPLGTPVNVTAYNSIFIAKYSQSGILQWVKTIKVNATSNNVQLALDGQDNIYINGSYSYPIDFGAASTLTPIGSQDVFIAKYSPEGYLLYHKSIGGKDATSLNAGLVIGSDNSLYLTGNFFGKIDVDLSQSAAELISNESLGMYLAKYDANGNYQWAFRIPNIVNDGSTLIDLKFAGDMMKVGVLDINVNSSDEIFVTGAFQSTVNFNGTGCGVNSMTTKSIIDITKNGVTDMFIVRYTPTLEIPITNNNASAPVVSEICPGVDPAIIIGSIPVGNNYSYQWQQSSNNRTFRDIPGAVSKDFDPPVLTATTYYRRRVLASACAALNVSNVVTLTLLVAATQNTITAPSQISFCNNGDALLIRGSIPKAVGSVGYQWQQSTDNINFTNISGATRSEYDPPSVDVTTYYRRLITNIPCNIGTPSNTITITIIPVPVPTVSPEQTVCIGDGVTLVATGGIQYSWSPSTGLSATDIASPTAKPIKTTDYKVTVFNGNCVTMLTVKVIVVNKPTVNTGDDMEIMNGDKVQLNAEVSDVEGATYSWTPATYLDDPDSANPMASPTENIIYRLTVRSANGCFTVSDEVAINVREKLTIPNSFTPNGDGINDILTIPGLDSYKQSTLTIYDRAGQPIFKSIGYPKPWDGSHDGKPLPIGTYYYIIDLKSYEHKRLSGYIFLIK